MLIVAMFIAAFLVLAVALVRTFDPGRSLWMQLLWALDDLMFFGPGSGKPPL